ncbi:MAG: carboxypeptidase-like regulatory domain-containing protein [Bacteroidales bacterium]|nr:carboxypeptidase-like regulatory domain-containing protein [Bacteroidales bacterium]
MAAAEVWAQTDSLRLAYSVSGKVSDARTGKELPAVNVRVSGRQYATVSNADGVFVIKSDAPIRELVISHLGYKTVRQAVAGGEVSVRLTPDKYLLDASGGVFLVLRPIKVAPKMHRGVILTVNQIVPSPCSKFISASLSSAT